MMARVTHCNNVYLQWRDPRLYGGTTEFTSQEWEALPGYEVRIPENCLILLIVHLVAGCRPVKGH